MLLGAAIDDTKSMRIGKVTPHPASCAMMVFADVFADRDEASGGDCTHSSTVQPDLLFRARYRLTFGFTAVQSLPQGRKKRLSLEVPLRSTCISSVPKPW